MKNIFLSTVFSIALFSNAIAQYNFEEDCKLTIKDNQTGKSYTIVVHDISCAELIKSLIKK